MLPDFETLVKEIRSKRKDLDWSQKELANRAGVSQSLVAKLEQRMNVPNYESTRKVYETLERNLSSDIETAGDLANPKIVHVRPDDTRGKAAEIMKVNDFSQIPLSAFSDGEFLYLMVRTRTKDFGFSRRLENYPEYLVININTGMETNPHGPDYSAGLPYLTRRGKNKKRFLIKATWNKVAELRIPLKHLRIKGDNIRFNMELVGENEDSTKQVVLKIPKPFTIGEANLLSN
ncbi:hypothetical protein AKJ57_01410 [candidate division MSBL1 archaeon SCGC-AAA259A05]|uniref:HTH cro/C1-type domain-containing protein n=1 Tax=candidate division MSBL1 archaeon SCGC-AAA259A05 TaxID=1698259 RepID=A0A133UB41_9EURY|nr:hypothetical protein AKJ57_01410 [candidate division MSBL1 archaeon SCGC-AAA259A05]